MKLVVDEHHVYRIDGRIVPGVTQVLSAFPQLKTWQASREHMDRGTAVHLGVQLWLQGKLDEDSLEPRVKGRVNAIKRFLNEHKIEVLDIEEAIGCPMRMFAGKPDLVGMMEGSKTLCDWKGSITDAAELQLAAYAILYPVQQAVAVECADDGSYRCKWMNARDLKQAGNTFLNFLSAYHWLSAKKLV